MHPHCGAGTYVYVKDGKYLPIMWFIDVEGLFEYLSEVAHTHEHKTINRLHVTAAIVSHLTQFIDTEKSPKSVDVKKLLIHSLIRGTEDIIKEFYWKTMFLGIMHLQDLYNIDLARVEHCGMNYATPDGCVIPFCSYNSLHREKLSASFRFRLRSRSNRMLIRDFISSCLWLTGLRSCCKIYKHL